MGKNDNYYDVDFSNYKATTNNPGELLIRLTVICCLFFFLLGFLAVPGKILHPISKRLQEWIAWWQSKFDREEEVESSSGSSSSEEEDNEMPWREQIDEESGKTFYYHQDTKKRTWRKPVELYKSARKKRKAKKKKNDPNVAMDLDDALLSNEHSLNNDNIKNSSAQEADKGVTDNDDTSHHSDSSRSSRNGRFNKLGRSKSRRQLPEEDASLTISDFTGGLATMDSLGLRNMVGQANQSKSVRWLDQVEPPMKNPGKARRKEIRKINSIAIPWMFQSIISEGSSIVTLMMISHLMSFRDLLAYSNVWFIIYIAFVINDAWYNALYKHVNISAALDTADGYIAAGRYIKIGVIGNILISIPFSVVAMLYMPSILLKIGYDESVAEISRYYTGVAILNNMFDTTIGIIDCVLDIEGHAKWGAVYDFWDTVFSTIATYYFIIYVSPSLLELGFLHLGLSILSTIIYFKKTDRKGWFEKYRAGMSTNICSLNWRQTWKLVKMGIPLTAEAIIGNIEYAVFTVFAAHQGAAEAAAWILLSYVWTTIGVVPDTFSSAASCHVARIISTGETDLAKMVAKRSVYIATYISIICSTLMWIFRKQFIWCLAADETLDGILLEVIPYICLCYPLMTVGGAASELNDALHLYKKVMVTMAIVTVIIMVPIGYIMTYIYEYNIEGLACAQCIGYTAAGVINIVFFINADWERAVVKAQDIGEAGTDNSDYYEYARVQWSELSKEVRDSAEVLGYNENIWNNGVKLEIDRLKMSKKQKIAVYRLKKLSLIAMQ